MCRSVARVTARELFGPAGPVSLDYPQVGLTQDGAQQRDSTGTKAGELHTGMKTDGAAGGAAAEIQHYKKDVGARGGCRRADGAGIFQRDKMDV